MSTLLSIDPGSVAFGWASWQHGTDVHEHGLVEAGTVSASRRRHLCWEDRLRAMIAALNHVILIHDPLDVAIEWPYTSYTARGVATAGGGSLVKLSASVGAFAGEAWAAGAEVYFVPVGKWKGNLKKDQVEKRIRKIMPTVNVKSHAWDAIGVGLYHLGVKI